MQDLSVPAGRPAPRRLLPVGQQHAVARQYAVALQHEVGLQNVAQRQNAAVV
jgi:hypothetical protein